VRPKDKIETVDKKETAIISKKYDQPSIKRRIEAFFLDNIGKVVTREQLIGVAKDPRTGKEPENWHQRLSELRTDDGYTILSERDRSDLGVGEYLMVSTEKRKTAGKRVKPDQDTWQTVLKRANNSCQWVEGGQHCGLKGGDVDPIGGGTVRLTPDHKTPHSLSPNSDPSDPSKWQALCGRHQVMKKNYWDDSTGWINVLAIVQAASRKIKQEVYEFLKKYFGDS
jgi:hypothetical protein